MQQHYAYLGDDSFKWHHWLQLLCEQMEPKSRNKDELHFPHPELMKCVLVYEKKKKNALASQINVF